MRSISPNSRYVVHKNIQNTVLYCTVVIESHIFMCYLRVFTNMEKFLCKAKRKMKDPSFKLVYNHIHFDLKSFTLIRRSLCSGIAHKKNVLAGKLGLYLFFIEKITFFSNILALQERMSFRILLISVYRVLHINLHSLKQH